MKRYELHSAVLLTAAALVVLASCQSGSQMRQTILPEPSRQHEGLWTGKDCDGRLIRLVIRSDGTANMIIDKNDLKKTLSATVCLYIINYSKEPVTLDLEFMTRYFEVTEIKMRVDFLGSNMMRVWTNFNETEPTDQDSMFILKRKM